MLPCETLLLVMACQAHGRRGSCCTRPWEPSRSRLCGRRGRRERDSCGFGGGGGGGAGCPGGGPACARVDAPDGGATRPRSEAVPAGWHCLRRETLRGGRPAVCPDRG